MGNVGQSVTGSLSAHNLRIESVGFPQNTFRDEPGYRRELLKAVAACHPRMIMPVGSTLALARLRPELPAGILLPVGDAVTVALLESKVSSSLLAKECGIAQPRMYDTPQDVGNYPVIFKRDKSFGGSGVYRPRSREALEKLVAQEQGGKYLIEDFVEGCDYSVDAVRWNGMFRAACYRSLANRGQGPSTERETVDCPELCRIAGKILEYAGYNGVCGIDFRMDRSGQAFFLECNPRFTGGIGTQISSGFDIPYLLWKAATDSDSVHVTSTYSVS